MEELRNEENMVVRSLVTDSAPNYAKAKRYLAKRHPSTFFVPCWAHQINLLARAFVEQESNIQKLNLCV